MVDPVRIFELVLFLVACAACVDMVKTWYWAGVARWHAYCATDQDLLMAELFAGELPRGLRVAHEVGRALFLVGWGPVEVATLVRAWFLRRAPTLL